MQISFSGVFYAAEQHHIITHFMQNHNGFYAAKQQCIATHFMQNSCVCSSRIAVYNNIFYSEQQCI